MTIEKNQPAEIHKSTHCPYKKYLNESIVTWILRVMVGGIFLFSGFVKGIDPWGTVYKLNDYLSVMSIDIWPNLVLVGAFALSALEFLCGAFILLGCFRRSIVIIAALFMGIMLPLTLWIAISNPVADCGCFGEAYVISNWATFWKNVVLSAAIVWLLLHNKRCHWLITPALQWLAFVTSAVFIVAIELLGYMSQPLLDFRPYKIGEEMIDSELAADDEPDYVFIYEKDGIRKEFSIDDELPSEEEGWNFVDRKELPASEAANQESSSGKNLRIWSKDGEDDITEDVIMTDGKQLIVMMPDLNEVSPATTWKLNSLFEWSNKNDVTMIAVVSGSNQEIAIWEDLSMASYPIFTADDTQIKSVVRGNPGVVYMINGVVEWKSTLTAINIDDFLSPETSHDASNFGLDNTAILRNLSLIYLSVIAVLIILSFIPLLKRMYPSSHSSKLTPTHDDRVHDEE